MPKVLRWLQWTALLLLLSACSLFSKDPPTPQLIPVTATAPTASTTLPTPTLQSFPTPRPLRQSAAKVDRPDATLQRIAIENSTDPAVSSDGRFIAFVAKSDVSSLGDSNGFDDIYVYDQGTDTYALASIASDGVSAGNSWSQAPAISGDGRFVAFYSWANTLTPNDTNGVPDVFVRDLFNGITKRISVDSQGRPANDSSGGSKPALSNRGRYIAFLSAANNLVVNDTNQATDVFVYDLQAGQIARLSVASDSTEADSDSTAVALSGDGRFVIFASTATNLVKGVDSGLSQIYLHDRAIGTTTLVSHSWDDRQTPADEDVHGPAISADGRIIAFQSAATNLIPDDGNSNQNIFIYDREAKTTELISVALTGHPANGNSSSPALSNDGRYVTFISQASNLVGDDTNRVADIFIHDRNSLKIWRASVNDKGEEANDLSEPSTIASTTPLVIFASSANNLVEQDLNRKPEIFLYSWQGDSTYSLTGRVVDLTGNPLVGVEVSVGTEKSITAEDGFYVFPELPAGQYTLRPQKPGYDFLTTERTVQIPSEHRQNYDFRGFLDGSPPEPFLELPFDYSGRVADLLLALRDTDEGGRVDSWFDHAYPNYSRQKGMVLWDGRTRFSGFYFAALGCYDRRCYDGHNGIDFPYRDPIPETPAYDALPIRPAAPGIVVAIQTGCIVGNRRCGNLYGNSVILDHGNGYFTQYAHLAEVMVLQDTAVTRRNMLGVMGTTGNSYGIHLHFSVYRDDGNGLWDGDDIDLPVDPFGWQGTTPDPWVADLGGPTSYWLWRDTPIRTEVFNGAQGAAIQTLTNDVQVLIPSDAFEGLTQVEIAPDSRGTASQPAGRTMGHGFSLQFQDDQANLTQPTQDFQIQVNYDVNRLRHLNLDELSLYRWDGSLESWQELESEIDRVNGTVTATSQQIGYFDLRAPLLCPDDEQEPNDHYYDAIELVFDTGPTLQVQGIFDVDQDEDWYWLEAKAGRRYIIQVESQQTGMQPLLTLHDMDGLMVLEQGLSGEDGTVGLEWQAPQDGGYFVRVAQDGSGLFGCDVGYGLRVES